MWNQIVHMWNDDWAGKICIVFLAGFILITPFACVASIEEQLEWDAFAKTHCKVVGRMASSTGSGIGITGGGNAALVVTTTPEKTGYLCDDGITYWR